MITHDEARNALKEDNMYIVVDYINEQEKKDKLLDKLCPAYQWVINEVEKEQIQALEEELK